MDLDQVIEDDMVEFLDLESPKQEAKLPERPEETVTATRDWLNETRDYLKRNRPEDAKKEFEELKQRYHVTPDTHPEERRLLYEILQHCYIEIFNYINDRNRTSILLERLEQNPDAVFDQKVKPVDLQHVEHIDRQQLPEYEPLTRQTLQQISVPSAAAVKVAPKAEHKPIPSFDLSLPLPPPGVSLPPQLQALSQQASRQVPTMSTPAERGQPGQPAAAPEPPAARQEADEFRLLRREVSILLRRASTVAITSPERAQALLDEALTKISKLPAENSVAMKRKVELIRAASAAYQARIAFQKQFNDEYAHVVALCRLKNENAVSAFSSIYKNAEAFEQQFGMYKGLFTSKLKTLQKDYFLYDDEEFALLLRPYIAKLRRGIGGEQKMAYEELQHFVESMPPSHQRDRLQRLIRQVATRTQPQQPQPLPKPLQEDPLQQHIMRYAKRLRLAVNRKDTNSYLAILDEFARFANNQPSGEREPLLEAITRLRKKVRPADEGAILNLVRPHIRRIAAARAQHDTVELGLAIDSLTGLVRSLPESEEKSALQATLAEMGDK